MPRFPRNFRHPCRIRKPRVELRFIACCGRRPEDVPVRPSIISASGLLTQKCRMPNSKRIAGLVGPAIVAMIVSEYPLVQPHLYDAQIPPVVYLSGVLMFVAGLAIVRAHNHWA